MSAIYPALDQSARLFRSKQEPVAAPVVKYPCAICGKLSKGRLGFITHLVSVHPPEQIIARFVAETDPGFCDFIGLDCEYNAEDSCIRCGVERGEA